MQPCYMKILGPLVVWRSTTAVIMSVHMISRFKAEAETQQSDRATIFNQHARNKKKRLVNQEAYEMKDI